MNIQPTSAAASIAGTSQAAAKGGDADKIASDATNKQSAADSSTGKNLEVGALDASTKTGDRGGDGRQLYDSFEGHQEKDDEPDAPTPNESQVSQEEPASEGHIDFEA
ncbi:hypothetical protein Poly51_11230 [Rubripirellula tenax]|uniref:Uncharacterized protein n=1 Tax=Rubripirellula tenax TaxID=2528015 RepID=A0A5C6FMU9_9BACT|nr:hypothetical protein [Rubripirellula tenax]TWU60842.1 hypothetical protein Poly51_11230 [Rubripirellula tenax]